jgi:hypothetical protein
MPRRTTRQSRPLQESTAFTERIAMSGGASDEASIIETSSKARDAPGWRSQSAERQSCLWNEYEARIRRGSACARENECCGPPREARPLTFWRGHSTDQRGLLSVKARGDQDWGHSQAANLRLRAFASYLSPDRVVVPLGVRFGPAFRVMLLFCPLARFAACLGPVRRPTPPVTSFRPGLSAGASIRLFFG